MLSPALICSGLGQYGKEEQVIALAKFILRASYRGTVLSAIENFQTLPKNLPGRGKLFLTLVGGGVFANDLNWVIEAISEQIELIQQRSVARFVFVRFSSFDAFFKWTRGYARHLR
jgi:hypothetical protein